MPVQTSVVGSYPKPSYLQLPDWFRLNQNCPLVTDKVTNFFKSSHGPDVDAAIRKATNECVKTQKDLGIDIISDGEMNRENYIYYFCRHLDGFDFTGLSHISMRNSATQYSACTARGPLSVSEAGVEEMVAHWRMAQDAAGATPVKATLPGPMTIINSTADAYYHDAEAESVDLVACVNKMVRAYVAAGCKHIQIDEPLLVRQPDIAVQYGINNLSKCFQGVGGSDGVDRIVHLCCGYPSYLDQEGYQKADKDAYWKLAPLLDAANIDTVSLEDAHRRNDSKLLALFKTTKVQLGVVKIASSHIESVDEIMEHLQSALQHIPAERLIASPDCGLGFFKEPKLLHAKLGNMIAAAKAV